MRGGEQLREESKTLEPSCVEEIARFMALSKGVDDNYVGISWALRQLMGYSGMLFEDEDERKTMGMWLLDIDPFPRLGTDLHPRSDNEAQHCVQSGHWSFRNPLSHMYYRGMYLVSPYFHPGFLPSSFIFLSSLSRGECPPYLDPLHRNTCSAMSNTQVLPESEVIDALAVLERNTQAQVLVVLVSLVDVGVGGQVTIGVTR